MKLSRLFAVPAILALGAGAIEAPHMPGGDETARLQRYRDGNILVHMPEGYREGAADQCLVEDASFRTSYSFYKSTDRFVLQSAFSGLPEGEKLGSLPGFTVINTACGNLNLPVRKWSSFEEFRAAVADDLAPLKERLRALAGQQDATRFSVVLSLREPGGN